MSIRNVGTFLLLEGALVTSLLLARAACIRILPADVAPMALRRRIQRGNQVAPAALVLSVVAVVIGGALRLSA